MAQMDGSPVLVNDAVFDTQYGTGEVEQILIDNRFTVLFSGLNRRVTYNGSGLSARFQVRTLFWHDPIIAVPAKSDANWLKIKQIATVLVSALRA